MISNKTHLDWTQKNHLNFYVCRIELSTAFSLKTIASEKWSKITTEKYLCDY